MKPLHTEAKTEKDRSVGSSALFAVFMDPIPNPMIPNAYANFAKACASLADSHGITAFQLKITPKWRDPMPAGVQVHGDVQINYTASDGRGRPCANLSVYLTTNTQLGIVRTPESSAERPS